MAAELGPFENGLARIGRTKAQSRIHLMREGGGVLCRPTISFERLHPVTGTNDPTCAMCIAMAAGKRIGR